MVILFILILLFSIVLSRERDNETPATSSSRPCVYGATKLSLFYREKASTDITLLREIEFENGKLPSQQAALAKAKALIRDINVATAKDVRTRGKKELGIVKYGCKQALLFVVHNRSGKVFWMGYGMSAPRKETDYLEETWGSPYRTLLDRVDNLLKEYSSMPEHQRCCCAEYNCILEMRNEYFGKTEEFTIYAHAINLQNKEDKVVCDFCVGLGIRDINRIEPYHLACYQAKSKIFTDLNPEHILEKLIVVLKKSESLVAEYQ